jgi:hypothetical protein
MQHNNQIKLFGILVTALVLVAMMAPAKAATWDSTMVYYATSVTKYDVAVGSKLKGASDDTVRIVTTQSGSPYYILISTDRSTALPMSWVTETVTNTVAMRGCAIGDVDGDGQNEIIVGQTSSPYGLKMVKWTGGAWVLTTIMTSTSSTVGSVYDIAIGDADNNAGTPNDIIFNNGSYGVMKARWNGATFDTTRILYNSSNSTYYGVAIGDFDATTSGNEIVTVSYGQRIYRIHFNGATYDTATIYYTTTDYDFYDVAVGDFDASNPGAEIAISNGYPSATSGVWELFGSGATWTMRMLFTPGNWSSNGEVAIGDFYTSNPGDEIAAVCGSGSAYEARVVYGSGTTWYTDKIIGTGGSSYGIAIGNLDRYRPGNEVAVGGNYKVWEVEQKLLNYDMAAISVDNVPAQLDAGATVTVKTTVKNFAEYNANAPVPVKMSITGPGGYSYTDVDQATSTNLPPAGTEQIVFSPDWTVPSTLGVYTIKTWTELPGDQIPSNDTCTYLVTVIRAGGLNESFTGTTFPPPGWTRYNFDGGDQWIRYTSWYHSAPACAEIYYDVPNNDWLITPRLKVVSGDNLTFWWRTYSTSYQETLFVRVSTNPNVADTGSYSIVDLVTSTGNINWFQKVVDLSAYAGQDVYIAFWYRVNNMYGMGLDDITGPYFPPQIQVTPDSVYAEGYVDSFFDIFFNVANIGGGTLNYSSALSTPAGYLSIIPSSGSLGLGMSSTDTLRFNTTGLAGHYYDTLVVTSNSGTKATNLIPIHLYVRMVPNISLSPDSFAVGVEANGTLNDALYVNNTGNGELNWAVETFESSKSGAVFNVEPPSQPHKMETNLDQLINIPEKERPNMGWGIPPTKGQGGPDAFGYKWKDSDAAGGPVFNWVEINAVGTMITTGDDVNSGPFPIGFPFKFYGNTFTDFRICSNGWISFTSTVNNLTNDTIPNPPEPNNLLALFWDDLNPASAGHIYYYYDGSKLIIEYDHVVRYSTTNCPYTMEAILYPNGKILYQYLQMGDGTCTYLNSATIGIENGTGTVGLEVVYNANYVHDNMAIVFSAAPSWIVFAPESGVAPAFGADTVDVTFDATGILGGEFYGGFVVHSDDPDTPVDTVPVHMSVLAPTMTFSPDSIMTTATEGQAPFNVTMDIGNSGTGKLVFSITEGIPWLSVAPVSDTVMPGDPASTITLTINAGSLYAGHYHGELKVYSNDPDQQPYATYQVYLTVGPNPDIAVTPDSFYVGLYAGYTKDTTMHISNTGDGHLTWGIAIEELGKSGPDTTLYEGFEGTTFPPTDWTIVNNDGGSYNWARQTSYYHTGVACAFSHWESSTLRNDDWLITPRISIGSNDTVSFWGRAYSTTWPESLEVRLSTTTNDVSAFTHLLWAGTFTTADWVQIRVELGKFARGKVYIAFVNKGLDEFYLMIDDVEVLSYAGPWLTVDPISGVTNPHSSNNVGVHFASAGIENDMYANLWITSNDPDESPILVPVHMEILGPNYSETPETLVIDALENQYTDGHIFIGNYSGHAPLAYKITDVVPWLSETPDTTEVPIDGSQDVTVTVDGNQLIAGDYTTKLSIKTNDFVTPNDTVVVIVHMGPPPDIAVSPESLRVTVPGGSTHDEPLTIYNNGDGHLAFEITTEETGPKAVSSLNNRYSEILKSHPTIANIPSGQNATAQLSASGFQGNKVLTAPGVPIRAGGDTVYVQWPHDPSDTWSFGTSDAGAGYKMYDNFWGVTLPIKSIEWWGLCLKYSGGWIAGNPDNLRFNVIFYSDPANDPTMPPNQTACTFTNVAPTVVHTGVWFTTSAGTFEMIKFTGLEVNPLCNLPEGWVSIQSQSAGTGSDWFLWASAKTGDGFSYQEGSSTPSTTYDRGFLMLGGAAWLSVAPEADTVDPHANTTVTVHFDATNILGGDKYGNINIASNDPDKSVLVVPVHMIVAGANYSVHPLELDVNALEGQITPSNLTVSNPGGIGTLSFKMTWVAPWLTAIPDTADVPPDGSQNVTVRVDGNQLIAGNYYAEIMVKTNAANQQLDTIPVNVHVGPDPNIALSAGSMRVSVPPSCNREVPLRVTNTGSGHLAFSCVVESAKPEGKADVLLVDDDGSSWVTFTDVRSYFTSALTANGYTYDVFDVTTEGGNGPDLATMSGYGAVIWFTGECWQNNQTLTPTDEANLGAYLDNGGRLFLSAQDYFYDRYLSAGSFSPGQFPYDYLHVSSVVQDEWTIVSPATGSCVGVTGSLTDGMSFSLWDPYTTKLTGKGPDDGLYIDQLTHSGVNFFQMTNPSPTGYAALQYESPKGYKVVFTTVDFAGLTDGVAPSTKAELMKRIMEWFAGGGPVSCPFTLSPQADTLAPSSHEDLILTFDPEAFEECSEETVTCNIVFTTNDPDEPTMTVPVSAWFGRGDVFTPSCLVDVGDVIYLLNYILKGGPAPNPLCVGDVAQPHDDMVDMSDLIYLLQYLYNKGSFPVVAPAVSPTPMQR